MQSSFQRRVDLGVELNRLARLGANIVDAHTFLILLPAASPQNLVKRETQAGASEASSHLTVAGSHTLSNHFKENALIEVGQGILGFIAKHRQAVHVSPFDRDSRLLGIYSNDVLLKSFLGFPVPLKGFNGACGVAACDSKKSYAFSKLQEKLLEELALEIGAFTDLSLCNAPIARENSMREFLDRGIELIDRIGINAVEVLRVKFVNIEELEQSVGVRKVTELYSQAIKLIRQSIPPEIAFERLPSGDVLMIVDNMVSSFIENKIESLCQHILVNGHRLLFEFRRAGVRQIRSKSFTIEDLIALTAGSWNKNTVKVAEGKLGQAKQPKVEVVYERQRA